MAETFTAQDLRSNPSLTGFEFKGQDEHIFIDTSHECWRGNVRDTLAYVGMVRHREDPNITPIQLSEVRSFPIYRRRKHDQCERPYHQIADFKIRAGEVSKRKNGSVLVYAVDPMLLKEKAAVQKTTLGYFRSKNLPLKRFYMMGNPSAKLHCPLSNQLLDEQHIRGKMVYNLAEGHHIVCLGGTSIQKGGEDPSKLVSRIDLTEPSVESRAALEDMMRLTFLSASAHRLVHQFRNSDVNSYMNNELPWALRNEDNFKEFTRYLTSMGHEEFPSYDAWMDELTLEFHGIYDKGDYMLDEDVRE